MRNIMNMALPLTDENIVLIRNQCADVYQDTVKKRSIAKRDVLLSVEETLTMMQHYYGRDAVCNVTGVKRLKKVHFEFSCTGPEQDPVSGENEEMLYSQKILQRLGLLPTYHYREKNSRNLLILDIPIKKNSKSSVYSILISIVLAILVAQLFRLFPEGLQTELTEGLVVPIFTKMNRIIAEIATPLVFFSVIDGIIGIGSSSAVGKMGRKFFRGFVISYAVVGVATIATAFLFFPVVMKFSNSAGDSALGSIVQLVLDMFPNNLVEGFLADNDLQIIALAILLGMVILSMGKKSDGIAEGISLLSEIVNKTMSLACKLLPLIVFFGILNTLLTGSIDFVQIYKVALAFLICSACVILSLLFRLRRRIKLPFSLLFRKQLPTLLINLSTSSQVAALPENYKCCKESFGIDPKLVDFSLPLGIVIYMPCGAAFLGLLICCVAPMSGVSIDLFFLIKLVITSIIVAIAAPPIPGSAFAVMPILFSACNVPLEHYSIAIILGTILAYFTPMLNGYCIQLHLLITAHDLDMVDREKLMKPME